MPKLSKKKQEEGLAFLANLVKSQGLDISEEEFHHEASAADTNRQIKTLQAEGVLLFLQSAGKAIMRKECKECGSIFGTHYRNIAYCSDPCRATSLRRVGIKWDPTKDSYSNLGAERPIVVSPQTYQCLLEFAERILSGEQEIRVAQEEQHLPPTRQYLSDLPTLPPPTLEEPDQTTPDLLLPELTSPEVLDPPPFDPLAGFSLEP